MDEEILSAHRKALLINLDPTTYGTFAEIGGGQEVARTFFQAGAASGTVAKTISAYDKSFSDHLYNENNPGRYVSEARLMKMLGKEYSDLEGLLKATRGDSSRFFVFANTVATLNFKKDNMCHGWIGVRFQLESCALPNDVIMHIKLLENDSLLQQSTLGILGVNLLYACFTYHQRPIRFLQSLMENLSSDRLEITMIRMSGSELNYVDNRLLAVQLVKNGMAKAIMFDRHGKVQEPADMLFQKNVLAFRGSFRPITYVGFDMLKTSFSIFKKDEDYDKYNTLAFCEMTLSNLLEEGNLDEWDFLNRVDILNGMGQNVMVSNYREFYKLVEYFSQFRIKKLRVVIGILTFMKVLDERYYADLKGGILEALGKLFPDNLKLYVYPALDLNSHKLITSRNLLLHDDLKHLYDYLITARKIIDIPNAKKDWLHIFPHDVVDKIKKGDKEWEKMVPVYVSNYIKAHRVFGYLE
jgi:hypothetical protein